VIQHVEQHRGPAEEIPGGWQHFSEGVPYLPPICPTPAASAYSASSRGSMSGAEDLHNEFGVSLRAYGLARGGHATPCACAHAYHSSVVWPPAHCCALCNTPSMSSPAPLPLVESCHLRNSHEPATGPTNSHLQNVYPPEREVSGRPMGNSPARLRGFGVVGEKDDGGSGVCFLFPLFLSPCTTRSAATRGPRPPARERVWSVSI
jgi:hypothetical protein